MRRGSLHPESRAPRRRSMSMAALQSSPGADHGTTTQAGPSHTAPHTLSSPVPIGHTGVWSTGSIVGTLTLPLFSSIITWVKVP